MNFILLILVSVGLGLFARNNNWIGNSPFQATNSGRFLIAQKKVMHFSRMDFVRGLVTTSSSAGSMWRLDFPALTMPPGREAVREWPISRDRVDDEVNEMYRNLQRWRTSREKNKNIVCVIDIMTQFMSMK